MHGESLHGNVAKSMMTVEIGLPYSLDQTPRILIISFYKNGRLLYIRGRLLNRGGAYFSYSVNTMIPKISFGEPSSASDIGTPPE